MRKAKVGAVVPKYIVCLRYLLERGSLVELEAFRLYGETCLHSTISTLANSYGFTFHRVSEKHRHRGGGDTHFTRYSLIAGDRRRAVAMVKAWFDAANDEG